MDSSICVQGNVFVIRVMLYYTACAVVCIENSLLYLVLFLYMADP